MLLFFYLVAVATDEKLSTTTYFAVDAESVFLYSHSAFSLYLAQNLSGKCVHVQQNLVVSIVFGEIPFRMTMRFLLTKNTKVNLQTPTM